MSLAILVPVALNVSIALIVLSLGLQASIGEAAYLIRHPGLLLRSIVSMNVIMPIFAVILVLMFNFHPAVDITIVALALSPVPPFLPATQTKAGGLEDYVVSLLVITALLSIVIVPLGAGLLEPVFQQNYTVPLPRIWTMMALTITIPLIAGMIIHDLFPSLARKVSGPFSTIGLVLLAVLFVPLLVTHWDVVWSMVGNGALVALTLFGLVGLAVGHFLGGPDPANRLVLATATAARHPGVALAVATASFPNQEPILSVVLWHLAVGAVLSAPYKKWMHLLPAPDRPQKSSQTKRHSPSIR